MQRSEDLAGFADASHPPLEDTHQDTGAIDRNESTAHNGEHLHCGRVGIWHSDSDLVVAKSRCLFCATVISKPPRSTQVAARGRNSDSSTRRTQPSET